LQNLAMPMPCHPFRLKFRLTSAVSGPIPRSFFSDVNEARVCEVIGILGPKPSRFPHSLQVSRESRQHLQEPWQNFLLGHILRVAQTQGIAAVALLRPEFQTTLTHEHLKEKGLSAT